MSLRYLYHIRHFQFDERGSGFRVGRFDMKCPIHFLSQTNRSRGFGIFFFSTTPRPTERVNCKAQFRMELWKSCGVRIAAEEKRFVIPRKVGAHGKFFTFTQQSLSGARTARFCTVLYFFYPILYLWPFAAERVGPALTNWSKNENKPCVHGGHRCARCFSFSRSPEVTFSLYSSGVHFIFIFHVFR